MDRESNYNSNKLQAESAPTRSGDAYRRIAAFRISLVLGLSALAASSLILFGTLSTLNWMEIGTLVSVLTILLSAFASIFANRSELNVRAVNLMLGTLWVSVVGITLLNSGLGLILAVGLFALTIGIAVEILPASQINRAILFGTGISTGLYLVDLVITYPRIEIVALLQTLAPFAVALELLIYIIYLVKRFTQLPLLAKIFVPFVSVSLFSIGFLVAFKFSTLIVVVVTSIGVVVAGLIARVITNPVTRLLKAVSNTNHGDLESPLSITNEDEIGKLAVVFNSIVNKLNQTLLGFEQLVAERTLEQAEASAKSQGRSQQLEAISEISRVITTERNLQKLLQLVVSVISERLGFYHVGIFLLDRQGEYAILRAANSEGGQRMLKRGHSLRVGQQGIIGYVTGMGRPRVALDVGEDAVFFNNPDLPETRSEMGLPLILGDQLIGALDVQSTEAGAFSEADINLLSTLADQVTIAIENARLFSETEQALSELQAVQRTYLRDQWNRQIEMRHNVGFAYEEGQLRALPPDSQPQAILPMPKQSPSLLSVPISLRGEVIGYIDLEQVDGERIWTEEEITLARSVSEQIGLALENARLIEESQRRAERESLVSQITTRLRASTDSQTILQTAVSEIRNALRARTAHIVIPTKNTEIGRRLDSLPPNPQPDHSNQNIQVNRSSSETPSLDADEYIG